MTIKRCIAAHALQDLRGERTHARPVLHDDTGPRPVHGCEHGVHEEARARDDRPEHVGVTQEIAGEEASFARAAGSQIG